MHFVSYNIQYSRGKDDRHDLARIASAVEGADLICLQEVTRNMPGVPDDDQPGRLGDLLPDYFWTYGPPVDIDAGIRDASGRPANRRLQFGNMILSRYPIRSSRLFLLPRCRSFDTHNQQCGVLEGIVALPSGPLRIYCVHLNSRASDERMAQIDFLLARLFDIPREGGACTGPPWREGTEETPMSEEFVLMGDCNLTPNSREYERIVGEPDYYHGYRIVAHHPVDTWTQAGHERDGGVTWYDAIDDWKRGLRLDYAFVSAGLARHVSHARIDGDAAGSDHQPYWFSLSLQADMSSASAGGGGRRKSG